jgi:restriction system protein|tara:strand:- start:44 stop:877 length:834 start_codon:yes stop_codon:yes gene_type:complete
MAVPTYKELMNPLLIAIRNLGGSASISEMEEEVATIMDLTDDTISEIHRGNRTKYNYNMAWSRTYLKGTGYLTNSERAVWALTPQGMDINDVDPDSIAIQFRNRSLDSNTSDTIRIETTEIDKEIEWEDNLLELIKNISSEAFERLCQRLLREAGFVNVVVTGRSGDGGIDGKGVLKINRMLSFHVYFQSKRYRDAVSSPVVRDFRGAMEGRADKGIIMTTGRFTRDAEREALREGANPIDLIDGHDLVLMLKDYGIGVNVEKNEIITIDNEFFETF